MNVELTNAEHAELSQAMNVVCRHIQRMTGLPSSASVHQTGHINLGVSDLLVAWPVSPPPAAS